MDSNFKSILKRILPRRAVNGRIYSPGVTHADGFRQDFNAPRVGRKNHGGVDINYHHETGASVGQNGINMAHGGRLSSVRLCDGETI